MAPIWRIAIARAADLPPPAWLPAVRACGDFEVIDQESSTHTLPLDLLIVPVVPHSPAHAAAPPLSPREWHIREWHIHHALPIAAASLPTTLPAAVIPESAVEQGEWVVTVLRLAAQVADLEQQVARLAREAQTDPLTGLLNRRGWDSAASKFISPTGRSCDTVAPPSLPPASPCTALALFDLDRFKEINDVRGLPAGDQVLRQVGRRLQSCQSDSRLIARWGGDEFAVLLRTATETEAADQVERLRHACDAPDLRLTASAGWALATESPSIDLDALLRQADTALRQAKANGGDQTIWRNHPTHG